MALGTAAVVRTQNGIALLPGMPAHVREDLVAKRTPDPPQIIVVAEEYTTALTAGIALDWAEVVGFVAQDGPENALAPLPAVVGIHDPLSVIENEILLLVDAARGLVFTDPDPILIAQYQAEAENIAPKERLFLDDAHQAAKTIDGQTIPFVALAQQPDEIEQAMLEGADVICTSLEAPFQTFEPRPTLRFLADHTFGKPIWLSYDPAYDLRALLRAAVSLPLTLVVPAHVGEIAQLKNALQQAEAECMEKNEIYALPDIAAELDYASEADWPDEMAVTHLIESLAAQEVAQLLFAGKLSTTDSTLKRFAAMMATAISCFLPVTFHGLEGEAEERERWMTLLIGAGVSGFLDAPKNGRIAATRELIRRLDTGACRARLIEQLNA
jgi:hypothetical protein